jgi:hypothetical protein
MGSLCSRDRNSKFVNACAWPSHEVESRRVNERPLKVPCLDQGLALRAISPPTIRASHRNVQDPVELLVKKGSKVFPSESTYNFGVLRCTAKFSYRNVGVSCTAPVTRHVRWPYLALSWHSSQSSHHRK